MTARYARTPALLVGVFTFAAAIVWTARHAAIELGLIGEISSSRLTLLYAVMYGWLVWQFGFSYVNHPARVTPRKQRWVDRLSVAALVPVYNEDPGALRACLASLVHQTRQPQSIAVVDDGSADPASYEPIRAWFHDAAESAGIEAIWVRQDNGGKRSAQMRGVANTPRAEAYWTTDSDCIADQHALGELLKPMADPRVRSVAGVILASNASRSLLTRIMDAWLLAGQLGERAALSVIGSVLVNSGACALYRAEVLRRQARLYLTEEFAQRRVKNSDDSFLTLMALLGGRTVQQSSAFAFTLMPEKFGHFTRMYLRWMRGSSIRALWRARYLPLRSAAWWLHLVRWMSMVMSTVLFVWFVLLAPLRPQSVAGVLWLAGVPIAIGYAQTLRCLAVRRSDQSRAYQWATWALAPLGVVFAATVLRGLRWWGMATCRRAGWGTRTGVEITLGPPAEASPAADDGERAALQTAAYGPTLALSQIRARATVPQ